MLADAIPAPTAPRIVPVRKTVTNLFGDRWTRAPGGLAFVEGDPPAAP
jgi:hypothetical protein